MSLELSHSSLDIITNNITRLSRSHLLLQRPEIIKYTVFYMIRYRIIIDNNTSIHTCIFFEMYAFVRATGKVS